MNPWSQPRLEGPRFDTGRQQVQVLIDQIAHLAEQDIGPADFYGPLLQGILQTLSAPAGVIWAYTAQETLQPHYQVNLQQVDFGQGEEDGKNHDRLLSLATG